MSNRLIELGEEVVTPLEKRWEITLKPELQERIENVIKTNPVQYPEARNGFLEIHGRERTCFMEPSWWPAFSIPNLEYEPLNDKIEKIKRDIWLELNNELTALEKVKVINYFMYDIHKFDKSLKKAHTPQLYLVNHVIDTFKGSPVMLGLIYAELARRLNLPIYGVNLPRNFVLCYYDRRFPG